jgi:hypothetical protein
MSIHKLNLRTWKEPFSITAIQRPQDFGRKGNAFEFIIVRPVPQQDNPTRKPNCQAWDVRFGGAFPSWQRASTYFTSEEILKSDESCILNPEILNF